MADIEAQEDEIFRAGDYGEKGVYTEEDLDEIVGEYNPTVHEAPITLDHRQEGPAYGWVESLRREGKVLVAKYRQVSEGLREALKSGAYKKRSAEIYTDFGGTGKKYLRAVTFLGAKIPHVKGLADLQFSEAHGPAVAVDFEEEQPDKEEQPKEEFEEMPEDKKYRNGASKEPEENVKTFSEDQVKEMIDQALGDATKKFSEEMGRLKTQLDTERQGREAIERRERQASIHQFCEEMKRQGRFLPAWQANGVEAFMEAIESGGSGGVVKFGEAEKDLAGWFKAFLESMPKFVEFGERKDVDWKKETETKNAGQTLHERAVEFAEKSGKSYAEALAEVSRQDKALSFEFMTESGYHIPGR